MIQGSSHARTALRAAGHERCGRSIDSIFPPTHLARGSSVCFGQLDCVWTGTALLIPAEGEGAAEQVPVAPDGLIASHLVVAPAQRPFGLLVALLHPVPQSVESHNLAEISCW